MCRKVNLWWHTDKTEILKEKSYCPNLPKSLVDRVNQPGTSLTPQRLWSRCPAYHRGPKPPDKKGCLRASGLGSKQFLTAHFLLRCPWLVGTCSHSLLSCSNPLFLWLLNPLTEPDQNGLESLGLMFQSPCRNMFVGFDHHPISRGISKIFETTQQVQSLNCPSRWWLNHVTYPWILSFLGYPLVIQHSCWKLPFIFDPLKY